MKPVPVYCLTNTTQLGYKYSVLSLGLRIKSSLLELSKLKEGLSLLPRLEFILIWTDNKTEVESVQLGNTYISDMDKCPKDKCCQDKCCGCNLLFMFPGPFV